MNLLLYLSAPPPLPPPISFVPSSTFSHHTNTFSVVFGFLQRPFWFLPQVFHLESQFLSMVPHGVTYAVALVFMLAATLALAGDIVHHDDVAPRRPGCENNFVLVHKLLIHAMDWVTSFEMFIHSAFDHGLDACFARKLLEQWGDLEKHGGIKWKSFLFWLNF